MDERIREAFDQVRATGAQKEETRAFLDRARHRRAAPRRLGALAACVVLLVALIGGYWAYFVPTSAISVEGDTSLELEINRFDQVVGVQCEDDTLAGSLRFLSYAQALELLLDSWDSGQPVSITVSGDETQCGRLLEGAQHCAAGRQNVHCGQAGAGNASGQGQGQGQGQGHGHGYGHASDH
ncbi:hypothetical protein [Intestinimonas massiliensis (ex Afouda et al. 2020)]|uniref:hypothetical protein n=1 Tax=Intestinimonas massiliensis (ex Afouda et al. 2020) TaxID=1673721 RepID=UPI0010311171|nr:hypothetical protein [Intestinimonas massiliensis (ex Afouda et al. 2020)]